MADERDFELLDDYLTQRMSQEDRSAFEQKLQADPDLQHEHALQERMIKGIKDARVAELKSMLNNVAVPSNAPGNTVVSKIILGTVVSLVIAAAGYWYFSDDEAKITPPDSVSNEQRKIDKPAPPEPEPEEIQERKQPAVSKIPQEHADKNQTSAGTEHSKPSLAKKPDPLEAPGATQSQPNTAADAPVTDPFTRDTEGNTSAGNEDQPVTDSGNLSLIVETAPENRRYTFHYQFREGKLFLFGPFEKEPYEIIESSENGERAVFLYYQDQYFLLREGNDKIQPLEPINDPVLLKKLRE